MNNETTERKPDVATIKVTLTFEPDGVKIETASGINEGASKLALYTARRVIRAIRNAAASTVYGIESAFKVAKEAIEGEVTHE